MKARRKPESDPKQDAESVASEPSNAANSPSGGLDELFGDHGGLGSRSDAEMAASRAKLAALFGGTVVSEPQTDDLAADVDAFFATYEDDPTPVIEEPHWDPPAAVPAEDAFRDGPEPDDMVAERADVVPATAVDDPDASEDSSRAPVDVVGAAPVEVGAAPAGLGGGGAALSGSPESDDDVDQDEEDSVVLADTGQMFALFGLDDEGEELDADDQAAVLGADHRVDARARDDQDDWDDASDDEAWSDDRPVPGPVRASSAIAPEDRTEGIAPLDETAVLAPVAAAAMLTPNDRADVAEDDDLTDDDLAEAFPRDDRTDVSEDDDLTDDDLAEAFPRDDRTEVLPLARGGQSLAPTEQFAPVASAAALAPVMPLTADAERSDGSAGSFMPAQRRGVFAWSKRVRWSVAASVVLLIAVVVGAIAFAQMFAANNQAAQALAASVAELEAAEAEATQPYALMESAIAEYDDAVLKARAAADSAGPALASVAGMVDEPSLVAANAALAALVAQLDSTPLAAPPAAYERGDVDMTDLDAIAAATETARDHAEKVAIATREARAAQAALLEKVTALTAAQVALGSLLPSSGVVMVGENERADQSFQDAVIAASVAVPAAQAAGGSGDAELLAYSAAVTALRADQARAESERFTTPVTPPTNTNPAPAPEPPAPVPTPEPTIPGPLPTDTPPPVVVP